MKKNIEALAEEFINSDNLLKFSDIEIRKIKFFAYHYNRYARFCLFYNKDWQKSDINIATLKTKLQVLSKNVATQTNAVATLNLYQEIDKDLTNESKLRNDLLSFCGRHIVKIAGVEPAIDKEFCRYFIYLQDSFAIFYNKKDGKINSSLLFREIAKEFKKVLKEAEESLSTFEENSVLLPNYKKIGNKIYNIKENGTMVPVKDEDIPFVWGLRRICKKRFKSKTLEEKKKVVKNYLKL